MCYNIEQTKKRKVAKMMGMDTKIKTKTNQSQISKMMPQLEAYLNKEYNYLFIIETSCRTFIEKILKRISSSHKTVDIHWIKAELTSLLNEKIKQIIETDPNHKIIHQYIEKNIKVQQNTQKNLQELMKISKWLENLNANPTPDFYTNLVEKNSTIQEIVKRIVKNNKEKITKGDFSFLKDDKILLSLIKAYGITYEIPMDAPENKPNNPEISLKQESDKEDQCDMLEGSDLTATNIYLKELNPILLTKEEERELLLKIKQGDEKAKIELTEKNLRLVVRIAKRYIGKGLDFNDLIQAGNEGLLKAIDKFDIAKETRFSTYATPWIQETITREIENNGRTIRLPVNLYEKLNKYKKIKNKLAMSNNKKVTSEAIAKEMGISLKKVHLLEKVQKDTISSNICIDEGEKIELEDFFFSEDPTLDEQIIDKDFVAKIKDFMSQCLSEKERMVLILRFGIDQKKEFTLEEIARMYGQSRERIRQIEARALKRLRQNKRVEQFLIYGGNPDECAKHLKLYRQEYVKNPYITKNLLGNSQNVGKQGRTIYEYLNDFARETIDAVILQLDAQDQEILYLRYGSDLDHPIKSSQWTNKHKNYFYEKLIPNMRNLMIEMEKTNQTAHQEVEEASKESSNLERKRKNQ